MSKIEEIEKDFQKWSGFELEGATRQEKLDYVKTTHWKLECELDAEKYNFINRISEAIPELKCPECLNTVEQDELDMFGGLCEECNLED
jgi:Zn finger protein HypA/HybF involved in hydrogenase expression